MLTYCFKCKKDTESAVSKFLKNKNGRSMYQCVLYAVVKNQDL